MVWLGGVSNVYIIGLPGWIVYSYDYFCLDHKSTKKMISLFFLCLASFFNACMDKLAWHFEKSCFAELDPKFWNPNVSWKFARKIFGYKIDAWHLFKSMMIICIALFVLNYNEMFGFWIDFIIFGLVWNGIFNIYFNKILWTN